jgi:DNA mismatch repair ATPase MutL
MAKNLSVRHGQALKEEEMRALVEALFESNEQAYSPSGTKIIKQVSADELDDLFTK